MENFGRQVPTNGQLAKSHKDGVRLQAEARGKILVLVQKHQKCTGDTRGIAGELGQKSAEVSKSLQMSPQKKPKKKRTENFQVARNTRQAAKGNMCKCSLSRHSCWVKKRKESAECAAFCQCTRTSHLFLVPFAIAPSLISDSHRSGLASC